VVFFFAEKLSILNEMKASWRVSSALNGDGENQIQEFHGDFH